MASIITRDFLCNNVVRMLVLIKKYLFENMVAFLSVFLAANIMILFGKLEMGIAAILYLPLGAKILMYLLFGFRVLPGILLACTTSGVVLLNSWDGHLLIGSISACAGTLAPIIAMWTMQITQVCDFSNLRNIDFRHILFLVVFTSIISALLKFFVFYDVNSNIETVSFIAQDITGDILGSLLVIYFVLKAIVPLISKFYNHNGTRHIY